MKPNIQNTFPNSTATCVVDDAVGMEKKQWYVAIVQHNTEKRSAEKLGKKGLSVYAPTQTEYRIWKDGRKVKVDRVVIPSTIFIKCTEQERREIVKLPFINRFMTNKAGTIPNSSHKPLAIIPNLQIETLKFMLGQSDIPVDIIEKPFKNGDKVRVKRGDLTGLEGEIIDINNTKSDLIVTLNFFGCARLAIDTLNLELIK